MPYMVTAAEWLEIDGVALSTPAWQTSEMSDLWSSPQVRGTDVLVPGAAGVLPQRRRVTISQASVEVEVVGDFDWEGEPYANHAAGLATNCAHLVALAAPAPSADGTRTAVLHYATGAPVATRSGPVHVLRVRIARKAPNFAVAQFELSLPTGALT